MPAKRGTGWTEDQDAKLRRLWADGLSSAQIGAAMRMTKNAVVGRAHRLKLPPRPSPIVPVPTLAAEQRAALRVLLRQGFSADEMARRLGVARESVRRAMRDMGLRCLPPLPPMRSDGVRPLLARGAAVLVRAKDTTEKLRAEAFRRHAQPGGGTCDPGGAAAQPIPASAGVPARAGYPEAPAAGCAGGLDVSSLHLPPAVAMPRPGGFLTDGRGCRWPLWANDARPDGRFCGAAPRLRPDGVLCVYCPDHAARAFTCRVVDAPKAGMGRTVGWGRAA